MRLTPLDIKKQEFKKVVRGYDADEVDAFLEMVSDDFESQIREKNELSDELLKLKTQLQDYQSVEDTLKETLMTAQESVNESRKNSNREAELLIREAELKAEKILGDAKLNLAELKNELVIIKAQKNSFARRLKHLLESQIELIQVLELDDLGFDKIENKPQKKNNPAKYEQEKIEFEGVDDALTDEQPPEKNRSNPPISNQIEVKRVDLVDEKNEGDEQQSRISDQLII